MMERVYLDNAATTPVAKEVVEAMQPYLTAEYGNASSLHSYGRSARQALEDSRERIAARLNCDPADMVFTSGGTESNNLALKGVAFADKAKGNHIITTKIEHSSILKTCKWLESRGFEVTYLDVDEHGLVDPVVVAGAIRDDTILVSVGHANNEIGTIQDIREIGRVTREKGVPFHTDACQSFTKTELDVNKQSLDLVTVNSHKIHGPKGVGALVIGSAVELTPLAHGGGHEGGVRSGTEDVTGIVGFAKAVEIAGEEDVKQMKSLRDTLIKGVLDGIEDARLNGHPTRRLVNNANFSFPGIEGEALLLRLDVRGIACSTGSACSSKSLSPSHVLTAIGLSPEDAHSSLRMTLGRQNNPGEIDYVLETLKKDVSDLREMSATWRSD
jgi:cysteine desulfurase